MVEITKRLQRIDSFFDLVSQQLHFTAINPKNTTKARLKFFKDNKNPHFTYEKPDETLQAYKDILLEITLDETPLGKLFEKKRKELIQKIDVLLTIGTPQFSEASIKLYPIPDEKLVRTAYNVLKLPISKPANKIHRKDSIKLFRKAFNELGIKYKIRSVDLATSANIEASQRLLQLKKRERFQEDYVKRLIVHEIGAHSLRTENGLQQPLKIFKNGFANYLETEEGIAAYNEYRAGLMTNSIIRNYAGRVIAVNYALQHSFIQTYHHLKKYFGKKTAWKLTLRAKRGLQDTKKKGAYTKDVVYLKGFLQLLQFTKKNSIDELYIGKIGIKDLPIIQELKQIKPPTYTLTNLLAKEHVEPSTRRINEEQLQQLLKQ